MLNFVLIGLMLIASILLVGIIIALGLCFRGAMSIVFPGLGLVIATPLILVMLVVAECVIVLLASYVVSRLPAEQMLAWLSWIA